MTTISDLYICPLSPEWNKKTCNYWYLVYAGSYNHTAFESQAGLLRWATERNLKIVDPLPEHMKGGDSIKVEGSYRTLSHSSYDEFFCLEDVVVKTKTLSNGDYTLALITEDSDGVRTVHTLNPNCKFRPVYDYFAAAGEYR